MPADVFHVPRAEYQALYNVMLWAEDVAGVASVHTSSDRAWAMEQLRKAIANYRALVPA